ncbi:unnamed protein product [Amaranthus hypochondriacus]
MENYRSMSCREGRMPNPNLNLNPNVNPNEKHLRRSYTTCNYASNHNYVKQSSIKGWMMNLSDAELQRKKRVASYKVYDVQGKLKSSFRNSFRWIKNTCSHLVNGN